MKTLQGWNEFTEATCRTDWNDYARAGDEIAQDVIDYFVNIIDPRIYWSDLLQVGGTAYDYIKNEDGFYRGLFMTFAIVEGAWTYCGYCFAGETIDRSNDRAIEGSFFDGKEQIR